MNSNRGMYAEEIVNRTIDYYCAHKIALIEKRAVPIKIVKDVSNGMIIGKLLNKSLVDYCGCIKGKHIEFEVKETANDGFSLKQIQQHQYEYLDEAVMHSHWCFLIVYFNRYEEFYLIHFEWIRDWIKRNNKKVIQYDEIKESCIKLDLVYPGILTLIDKLIL